MSVRCKYCDSPIPDNAEFCPNCGAKRPQEDESDAPRTARSSASARYAKPRTIEELRDFCAEKGMPLEKMRFFIGEDYKEPRAFGIYRDEDGEFVVYKNKSDGSRAVRYKGPDEAFAVNELYEKLRSEVSERQHADAPRVTREKKKGLPLIFKIWIIFFVAQFAIAGITLLFDKTPKRGYYRYNDHDYYYYAGDWYYYDDGLLDWIYYDDEVDPYLDEHKREYYLDDDYDAGYGVSDFEDSDYWYGSDYGSDSDDYDWDSGSDYDSWDSGGTDWDSDW